MKAIFFVFLSVTFKLAIGIPFNLPPTFWCSNANLSEAYKTNELCSQYSSTVFNKPITITLLYEALCPGCQNMITTVLYPKIFQKVSSNFVQFELVPYGNARRTRFDNGTTHIDCQHGPVECSMNKLESCVISLFQDAKHWFPFINCLETNLHKYPDNPDKAVNACYKTCQIKPNEQKMIKKCHQSNEGDEIQLKMAYRTEGVWPEQHTWVPWILVNNVSLTNMQIYAGDTLMQFLCDWYKGDKLPPACSDIYSKYSRNFKNSVD